LHCQRPGLVTADIERYMTSREGSVRARRSHGPTRALDQIIHSRQPLLQRVFFRLPLTPGSLRPYTSLTPRTTTKHDMAPSSQPQIYSCKCLNVRVRAQPVPESVKAHAPSPDGDYLAIYAADEGITIVRWLSDRRTTTCSYQMFPPRHIINLLSETAGLHSRHTVPPRPRDGSFP
jgi:hypothetical protein